MQHNNNRLIILFILLAVHPLQATSKQKTDFENSVFLQSSTLPPPEGYPYRIINLRHITDDVEWDPAAKCLTCKEIIAFEHKDNLDSPLLLDYESERLDGRINSIFSSTGIDSVVVTGREIIINFSGHQEPGAPDTLIIHFRNKKDFPAMYNSRLYPQTERYFGLQYWQPLPRYPQGLFTIDLNAIAPETMEVISSGEYLGTVTVEQGKLLHFWRSSLPQACMPAFIIDNFSLKTTTSKICSITIYHHSRPDSVLSALSGYADYSFGKCSNWFGPPVFSRINIVESPSMGFSGLALNGLILLESTYLTGKQSSFNTSHCISHEIAHQWWGLDVLALEHPYMMESFAEYTAACCLEEDDYRRKVFMKNFYIPGVHGLTDNPPLVKPDSGSSNARFYCKGPWVLYMLENMLGKDSFFDALYRFRNEYSSREATLDDFFNILQSYYDGDLSWFREQWFEKPGLPRFSLRREWVPEGKSIEHSVIIAQDDEIYQIPLELGVFRNGSQTPEIAEIRLSGPVDTFRVNLEQLADSIVLDPNIRTLYTSSEVPMADILPLGNTPNCSSDYELRFYLDSLRTFRRITIHHFSENRPADSIYIHPESLNSGYGSVNIPPYPTGSKVRYYFSIEENNGNSFMFPAAAPDDSVFYFQVTERPDKRFAAYFSFETLVPPSPDLKIDCFPNYKKGILGLNLETNQPFATLLDAGNSLPQLAESKGKLVTLNIGNCAVDVIDIDNWRKELSIALPLSLTDPKVSAMNRKSMKYYLMGHDLVCEVDLISKQVTTLLDEEEQPNYFSLTPRQMEYCESLNCLLVKSHREAIILDLNTKETVGRYNLQSGNEVPHLLSGSLMLTVSIHYETNQAWLSANWYGLKPEFRLLKTVKSNMLNITRLFPFNSYGGHAICFQDETNKVIICLAAVVEENNFLIWDLSAPEDSVYLFTHPVIGKTVSAYQASDGIKCTVPSNGSFTLSLYNLSPVRLEIPYLDPFTGQVYNEPHSSLNQITGFSLPEIPRKTYCDINSDGTEDSLDIIAILQKLQLTATDYDFNSDIDRNGRTDIFDLLLLLKELPRISVLSPTKDLPDTIP